MRERGLPYEALKGYHDMMLGSFTQGPLKEASVVSQWASRQVYIALGTLLTTAALLKIDACPMKGFQNADYDKVLKLEGSPFASTVVCALGYRSAEDSMQKAKKVRFAVQDVIERL